MAEERRLAAIMFADVCGFSRIMGENEKRALAIVDMALNCIQQGADEYGGRTIKKLGDGALVEFASAVNAVRCALDVQQAIARHNARSSPEDQFQIRIGIHVGDIVVSEGDIMGDGVNVASRIEPLAEPGGICISRDVFDMVRSKVQVEAVNLGPCALKNISRQVDIYRLLIDAVSGPRPSIPRSDPGLTAGLPRNRKTWLVVAAAIGGLALLAAGGAAARHGRAAKEFARVSAQARAAVEEGKPEEALRILESYPAEFRKTGFQARLEEDRERVRTRLGRDRQVKEAVSKRQEQFLLSVKNNDSVAGLALIDPASLENKDRNVVWGALRFVAGLLKLGRVDTEDLVVERVDLSPDGRSATVHMRVRVRNPQHPEGIWRPFPPFEWRLIDGAWYLVPKKEGEEPTPSPPPREEVGRRGAERKAGPVGQERR